MPNSNDKNNKTDISKKFSNFGEYLYWAYANLQMLCYALNSKTPKFDRKCFMIRSKAFIQGI